jgi:hypothetical protein
VALSEHANSVAAVSAEAQAAVANSRETDHVRALRVMLVGAVVLAGCGGHSTLSQEKLRAVALRMAASSGEPHPTSMEDVETTRAKANRISSGAIVDDGDRVVFLIAARGHFTGLVRAAPSRRSRADRNGDDCRGRRPHR